MEIFGGLIAGAFIGSVLGFVGAGGAMLSVPILIYIFDFSAHEATTAALAVVFLAALSGAIPKARAGAVLYRDAFVISGIGLVTNLGFASISDRLPARFITTGFAIVLIVAAISMALGTIKENHTRMPVWLLVLISLIIGSMSGLFGIGGGFLAIPVLVLFFGTPQNIAAGTSLLIISLNSLIALLGHRSEWAHVKWNIPIAMAVGAVFFAQLASRAGKIASPETMRRAFAILLLAIALFSLAQTWIFV